MNGHSLSGLISELKISVPWGHIAAKAWGSHRDPPVLCLHAWLDNASSFDRLIPLLPKDFYYVAMDFGGHGLSSHYSPGFLYNHQNYVNEVRRVVAALQWNRFSLVCHSFGGIVGGMFSCIFPEMVDKLVLLETLPFMPDIIESENLLTYKRRIIEHSLQVEASKNPPQVVSPEEVLRSLLKRNTHVEEECGKLLLQRGTTQVATGLLPNRDPRLAKVEYTFEFISRNLLVHSIKKLQACVLMVKATQGHYGVSTGTTNREDVKFTMDSLKSILKERFQYVDVAGSHYVHMNQPERVAGVVGSFLQSKERLPAHL
ncbi:serine hydrolase-like protein 2 [Hippopotamus amphibius kiboko]|uniref:serine hydrolase-like protein 2 n=1 Tax=Hippopotamus amphibius kiboko TaxID=575201 RepID=UPI00259527FC|nr:serine hydrolase-like protein 2 [Hippopotamus amphibius kiboko]